MMTARKPPRLAGAAWEGQPANSMPMPSRLGTERHLAQFMDTTSVAVKASNTSRCGTAADAGPAHPTSPLVLSFWKP